MTGELVLIANQHMANAIPQLNLSFFSASQHEAAILGRVQGSDRLRVPEAVKSHTILELVPLADRLRLWSVECRFLPFEHAAFLSG